MMDCYLISDNNLQKSIKNSELIVYQWCLCGSFESTLDSQDFKEDAKKVRIHSALVTPVWESLH